MDILAIFDTAYINILQLDQKYFLKNLNVSILFTVLELICNIAK